METAKRRTSQKPATYGMADVAALGGMGYSTLHRQVLDGTFPVKGIKIGNRWKFPKAEIDRLFGVERDAA